MFNANPLMRYDGYYVLLDWLEIPNLREKSNRYLKNVVLDKCLGVEVQPEPYMAPTRKTLFITYAIGAWVYRWVVTFSILKFMDSFLQPYKLGVVSRFMMLFAAGSMFGWPLYNMGKNLYKRGRLPDMKRHKVMVTASVVGVVLLFLLLVPLPISRVRTAAVVEVQPEAQQGVPVPSYPAVLEKVFVKDGQEVQEGDELAQFSSRQVSEELLNATTQHKIREDQLRNVAAGLGAAQGEERTRLLGEKAKLEGERELWRASEENWLRAERSLKVTAPRGGVVMGCPRVHDLGKLWEKGAETPLCTIGDPNKLRVSFAVPPSDYALIQQDQAALREAKTLAVVDWLGVRITDKGIFPLNPLSPEQTEQTEQTDQPKQPETLAVTVRVQGREMDTWKGRLERLPEAEAKKIPAGLTHKGGGAHAIKPGMRPGEYVPQAQLYLLTAGIQDPDRAIHPGTIGQVKVHCRWQSVAYWGYRTVAGIFDIYLM
jgi:putative peptide zinc metalloprotease protein